jgi:hypothetical protein
MYSRLNSVELIVCSLIPISQLASSTTHHALFVSVKRSRHIHLSGPSVPNAEQTEGTTHVVAIERGDGSPRSFSRSFF